MNEVTSTKATDLIVWVKDREVAHTEYHLMEQLLGRDMRAVPDEVAGDVTEFQRQALFPQGALWMYKPSLGTNVNPRHYIHYVTKHCNLGFISSLFIARSGYTCIHIITLKLHDSKDILR